MDILIFNTVVIQIILKNLKHFYCVVYVKFVHIYLYEHSAEVQQLFQHRQGKLTAHQSVLKRNMMQLVFLFSFQGNQDKLKVLYSKNMHMSPDLFYL